MSDLTSRWQSHYNGTPPPLHVALADFASQEHADGPEQAAMMAASESLKELKAENERLLRVIATAHSNAQRKCYAHVEAYLGKELQEKDIA